MTTSQIILPGDLIEPSARFLCWKLVPRLKDPTQFSKQPRSPLANKQIGTSAEYASYWTDFNAALEGLNEFDLTGVGRLLQYDIDQIWSVDIDDCIDNAGHLNAYAADLVQRAGSYAEWTPSLEGIRIWCRGHLPPAVAKLNMPKLWVRGKHPEVKDLEVQIFIKCSYCTVTGNALPGSPTDLHVTPEFVDYLFHSNPRRVKEFYPSETSVLKSTGNTTQSNPNPVGMRTLSSLPKSTSSNKSQLMRRIGWMHKNSPIFRRNWDRIFEVGHTRKSNSEFQFDLWCYAYVSYQLSTADLESMCRIWCLRHGLVFERCRINSWIKDAQAELDKEVAKGRLLFKRHEAMRIKAYRAKVRVEKATTTQTNQPVGMCTVSAPLAGVLAN